MPEVTQVIIITNDGNFYVPNKDTKVFEEAVKSVELIKV